MDFAEHRRISQSFLTSEFSSPKVLANAEKENPISIAYGTERSSRMDRSDLSNLTAFVAVADRRSFRAAASQLGVTPLAPVRVHGTDEGRRGRRLKLFRCCPFLRRSCRTYWREIRHNCAPSGH
jgi:hypothetical protein